MKRLPDNIIKELGLKESGHVGNATEAFKEEIAELENKILSKFN